MKKLLLLPFLLSLSLLTLGQSTVFDHNDPIVEYDPDNPPARPPVNTVGKWVRTKRLNWNTDDFKSYHYNGMSFRLRYPENYDPSGNTKYPMVVMLTGRGELGEIYDNENNLKHAARNHEADIKAGRYNGFLFFPQSSSGFWGTGYLASINELITDHFPAELPVDQDRIVIHGLSAGGQAVWNFISTYPKAVSAALPMSAASPNYYSGIENFKHLPIWLSQGGRDRAPTPFTSRALVDEVVAAGGNIRYTVYKNLGHGVWYTHYREDDFWPFIERANKTVPVVMSGEMDLISTSDSKDVYEFITKYEICPGDPINVRLGLTAGFEEYQWRKDGQLIAGATGNEIVVNEFGTYDARFRRNGLWSDWSVRAIEVREKSSTETPDILVQGLSSKVIPTLTGQNYVDLELPEGFIEYEWRKEGSTQLLSTDRVFRATEPGAYVANVTEKFGCSSNPSNPFEVIDAAGSNSPANLSVLTGVALSKTEIRLDWSVETSTEPITSFEIYRSQSGGSGYSLIAIVGGTERSYNDIDLIANTEYSYQIRSVNEFSASDASEEFTVRTEVDNVAPTAPQNLQVVGTYANGIAVRWNKSVDDIAVFKYDVYRDGIKTLVVSDTTATIFGLTEGEFYRIQVKARDLTGNTSPFSNMVVGSASPSGLFYQYYHGTWSSLPDFNTLVPVASGTVDNFDISQATQNDNFAFYFEGMIDIPVAGNYTFETRSDDGSKLYIGEYDEASLVVNNDGLHGMRYREGTYNFPTPGRYPIIVTFFERGGGQGLQVYWKNTAHGITSRQRIPDGAFRSTVEIPSQLPVSPNAVTATSVSYDKIQVDWNDLNNDEIGYQVFRSNDSSLPFEAVAQLGIDETSFIDEGLEAETEYFYQVVALGEYGASDLATPVVNEIGEIKSGIAAQDGATGTGFILYSTENVFSRFSSNAPLSSNSNHLIAIKYIDNQWHYDNNSRYYTFSPASTDVIIAAVDFSSDQISSYEGVSGDTLGIRYGFTTNNDLSFFADRWNGGSNNGEFTVNGTYFEVQKDNLASASTLSLPAPPIAVQNLNVVATSTSDIDVSWTNQPNIDGYTLHRSLDGASYLPLVTLDNSTTTYADGDLNSHTEYYYFVSAINPGGESSSDSLSTTTFNTTPVLDELEDLTIKYDVQFDLQLFASDEDNDSLSYTLSNAPGFITLTDYEDGTALLTLLPSAADQGTYQNITLTVSDNFGGSLSQSFDLIVNDNNIPTLDIISNVSVEEGSSLTISLQANDPDGTENLIWSNNLPEFASLTANIDGSASVVINPDYIHSGVYSIDITVTDVNEAADTQSFLISVLDKNPNTVVNVNFTEGAYTASGNWNNTSGHPSLGDAYNNLIDTEGNTTSISLTIASNWTNNGSNTLGTITGDNSGVYPDNVLRTSYWTAANTETVTLGGLNDNNLYDLTFFGSRNATNDRSTMYSVGAQSVVLDAASNVDQTVSLKALAPSNGEITFTIEKAGSSSYGYLNALVIEQRINTGNPPALPSELVGTFNVDENHVVLNWNDRSFDETGYKVYKSDLAVGPFVEIANLNQDNVTEYIDTDVISNSTILYQVGVYNNNGERITLPVEVTIPNVAPVITALDDISIEAGSSIDVNINASDDLTDQITLSVSGLTAFMNFTDNNDGTGLLSVNPQSTDIGVYSLTVNAEDQNGGISTESLEVTVTPTGLHTYYINFAGSNGFSASSPWNNYIGGGNTGDVLNNITAEDNSYPSLSITLQDSWNGINTGGMGGSSLYPDNVTLTSLWTASTQDKNILVSGLSVNKAYDFTFFGSRNGGGDRTANYTINGSTVALNASFNQNQTVQIIGVIPNSSGEVIITVNKAASASYAYINSIVVDGYDVAAIPAEPTNLTAAALPGSIALAWDDNTNLELGYEIWRSTNGQNYTLYNTVSENITAFTDANVTSGVTNYYKVRADLGSGEFSGFSNIAATSSVNATVSINLNVTFPEAAPWNNTNSFPDAGSVFDALTDEVGSNTGMAFEIVPENPLYDPSLYGFSGDNPFGENTGNNSGVVPDNVMRSTWWMDPGKVSELKFFNLDLSQKYNFKFFASRAGNGNRTSVYSIGDQSVKLNAANNVNDIVQINNIYPDQNGEVLVSITSDEGSLFSYIGAIILESSNIDPNKASATARNKTPELSSSIADLDENGTRFNVFPNPINSGETLTITNSAQLAEGSFVTIADMNGRIIRTEILNIEDQSSTTVRLNNIKSGLYLVQIRDNQRIIITKKLLVN